MIIHMIISCLQHVDAETLLNSEMGANKDLKLAKLDAIDRLLWGSEAKKMPATKPEGLTLNL